MELAKLQLIIPDDELLKAIKLEVAGRYEVLDSTFNDYLESSESQGVGLVLCHQSVIEADQLTVIAKIKASSPQARILVVGQTCTSQEQVALLKHGIRGYYDCAQSLDRLNAAIYCILHGEVWVERNVISGLVDEITHLPEVSEKQRQAIATLSPKELEVAQLVSHGATNKMIANKMTITERTVKAHLTAIFHKLEIADRLSLAILFRDLRD